MKKKLGLFNSIVFVVNILVGLLLLLSFVIPFIPPKTFPILSLLSLVISPLIIINVLFVLYWFFKLNGKIIYSLALVLIAHVHFGSFIQYSNSTKEPDFNKSLKILSYNVRLFNAYEKKNHPQEVAQSFTKLIKDQQPDVICIQEYYENNEVDFSNYPYRFIHFRGKSVLGHAIFSKYPLVNKGSFDFNRSNNNTIYVDMLVGMDTLRIYNLHLQSLGIVPSINSLQEEDQQKFIKRVSRAFKMQHEQIDTILQHENLTPYPVIISGDFNNTPYSYIYHTVSKYFNDAFDEKGRGIGTTYLFDSYPTRIDYIFSSKELEIISFENIGNTFSDHYPISAEVLWDK